MFEQFIFAHYSGIILWQNKEIADQKAIDQIITQVLIEKRKINQPIEIRNYNYYFQAIDELNLIVISSINKSIVMTQIPKIVEGLTLSFIQEYETCIRSCTIDFEPAKFIDYTSLFNGNLASLVTKGQLSVKTQAKNEDILKIEEQPNQVVTHDVVQNAVNVTSEAGIDSEQQQLLKEEAKAKIKRLQEESRNKKSNQLKQQHEKNQENRQKLLQDESIKKVMKESQKSAKDDVDAQEDLEIQKATVDIQDDGTTNVDMFTSHAQQLKDLIKQNKKPDSFWGSVMKKTLDQETVDKLIISTRQKMIDSNVAAEIADEIIASIKDKTLVGNSAQRARTIVQQAVQEQVSKIIRFDSNNLLISALDSQKRRSQGQVSRPFVICIVGINGMGKTTTIAKLLYKFTKQNLKCFVCGCDSFRSGAIEQLQTHCDRLNCGMFQQGYNKNPSSIAQYGILEAQKNDADVVFIDTAGRMHNNTALMQELGKLVKDNKPDRVVYVGEALIGATGVTQLKEFDNQLKSQAGRGIDGVVLSKFDTIGDKVGTALNFTYVSGLPIYFVGIGQSYPDLGSVEVNDLVEMIV